MNDFAKCMTTYKSQMKKGDIAVAYQGLMKFMLSLRSHLKATHPDFYSSGNFYQGNLDLTFFSVTPPALKKRNLRVSVVFLHKPVEFRLWLGGRNKKTHAEYWEVFAKKRLKKYQVAQSAEASDFLVEANAAPNPDFKDLQKLQSQIERAFRGFTKDMERYVS